MTSSNSIRLKNDECFVYKFNGIENQGPVGMISASGKFFEIDENWLMYSLELIYSRRRFVQRAVLLPVLISGILL